MTRFIVLLLFATASTMSGCSQGLETSPEAVEAEISAALPKGADAVAIEKYLEQRSLAFTYDRFANRYQSIIRDPESDARAITIDILLDAQKRFAGVDARESHTLP
ncbi:MAG: hypothetical protein ABW034_20070 [Steroidobacteraceae bacterium]